MGKQVDHSGTSFQPMPATPLHWIFVCPFLSHHYETKLLWKKYQQLANCLLKLKQTYSWQVCSFLFSPQFPHSFAKWHLRVLYRVKSFEIWPVNFLFLSRSRITGQQFEEIGQNINFVKITPFPWLTTVWCKPFWRVKKYFFFWCKVHFTSLIPGLIWINFMERNNYYLKSPLLKTAEDAQIAREKNYCFGEDLTTFNHNEWNDSMNTILLKKEMNLLQVQPLLELLIQIYLQLEERKKSLKTYLLDQFIVCKMLTL